LHLPLTRILKAAWRSITQGRDCRYRKMPAKKPRNAVVLYFESHRSPQA
jgi:hypothetical protein